MKRPAYEFAFDCTADTDPNPRLSAMDEVGQAMAKIAWVADNFHYASYEQAQDAARAVLLILKPLHRVDSGKATP